MCVNAVILIAEGALTVLFLSLQERSRSDFCRRRESTHASSVTILVAAGALTLLFSVRRTGCGMDFIIIVTRDKVSPKARQSLTVRTTCCMCATLYVCYQSYIIFTCAWLASFCASDGLRPLSIRVHECLSISHTVSVHKCPYVSDGLRPLSISVLCCAQQLCVCRYVLSIFHDHVRDQTSDDYPRDQISSDHPRGSCCLRL